MAYSPQVWINDETDVDEEHMMHIEEGIKNSYNIPLLAVSASSPSECDEDDKYYNTITKKIYVATGTNTWSAEGTTPLKDILYILFSNNTAYAWNGEDLVSVGGGSINVNNSTITIKKNNVTVDSFTTNASSDKSINIQVPEKTSDLNNDKNFMVSDFMVAGNSTQQTVSGNNTPQKYNLNTNIASSGNKLTFNSSNCSIDIGTGVSYVEVSAQVYMMAKGSNGSKILTICKNDVQIVRCTMPTYYDNQTISIPSTIIPVQQNDKITLYIKNSAGNATFGDNTSSQQGINFLTVKVIK